MTMKLYDHQKKAINKLRNGSILCGGVGTGKSITALAFYISKICDGAIETINAEEDEVKMPTFTKPLYIITTARKRDTLEWDKELAIWGLSTDQEKSFLGTKVVIDSWNNVTKYTNVRGAFFIFDEQRVVGYGAWSKSFIKIARNNNRWIMLSATPGDTWVDYMSVFIANGFYKNKTDFYNRHVVVKWNQQYRFPKIERYLDADVLIKHRDEILVDMKFEKTTIPHHIYLTCDYDKEMYKYVKEKRKNPYEELPSKKMLKDISAVIRLLRVITNSHESRCKRVLDIFVERKKAIIFYNFDFELKALRKMCNENKIIFSEWNGKKHQPLPEGEAWLYLVQYTAGSEGWNCTTCDTIIFYSQTYSYKQLTQACGRIDRLNTQYNDLYYYHLLSESSIDHAINKTLNRKEMFNEKIAERLIFGSEEDELYL